MVGILLFGKVGEKGQVVIPKPIREKFNIDPHEEVEFDIEDDKIIMRKKKSGMEMLEEFFKVGKKMKIKIPKNIDWSEEFYKRYDE